MRLLSMAIFLLRVAHLTASEEDGPRVHALPGMARSTLSVHSVETLSVHSVESFARLKACQLPDITACGVFVLLVTRGVRLSYEGSRAYGKGDAFRQRVGATKANHSKPDVRRASNAPTLHRPTGKLKTPK
jgi:hypothetical protein